MRPFLPVLLLAAVASGGCIELIPGSNTGSWSPTGGQLKKNWAYDVSGAQGVAVNGVTGDVYLSVGATYKPPYADGGGIEVLSPQGQKRQSVPMVLPKACDGCTRLTFAPKGPKLSPDGRYVYVSDNSLHLFRLDTETLTAQPLDVPGAGNYSFVGIERHAAISPDGRYAYLPGTRLTTLDLAEATVEGQKSFDKFVRQIVPWQGNQYLLNLTENLDKDGSVAVWDAATGSVTRAALRAPLRGLAARDGWVVGVLEMENRRVPEYQVVELDFSSQPPTERLLASFTLSGSNEITMALRPDKKQAIIGTMGTVVPVGLGSATPGAIGNAGSTLVIDTARGAIAQADTSSVKGLALSPDDKTLYVADTGGLKAFALP